VSPRRLEIHPPPSRAALLAGALLLVFTACAGGPRFDEPSPGRAGGDVGTEAGLDLPSEAVAAADVLVPARPAPSLLDDADPASLQTAVGRSLEWLERLPPDSLLDFGVRRVAAGTLRASLDALHTFLATGPDSAELAAWVETRFEVVESIGVEGHAEDGADESADEGDDPGADDGDVLFTGYYEPIIPGARERTDRATVPVYGRPDDLVRVRLPDFGPDLPAETLSGRVADGSLVPYWTRNEIQEQGVLTGRGLEIAWVEDRVDLFFTEVQGSGAIRFPDGGELGISYAASNGRPYRSIGRLLIDDGLVPEEEMSMQAIRSYLVEQPADVPRVLDHNASYVFFRPRTTPPIGALGVPVTPGRSIATDLRLFPRGALAFIETTRPALDADGRVIAGPPLGRFMLNQDTGGAIRGPGRVDVFWGRGEDAAETAGRMQQNGRLFFLLPRDGSVARGGAVEGSSDGLDVVVLADLNSSYGSTTYEPEVARVIERLTDVWRPDLVLLAGDVVAGQKPELSDAEVSAMWAAFDSIVAQPLRRAGIAVAFTPGNHDASGHPGHERDRRLAERYWSGMGPDPGPDTGPATGPEAGSETGPGAEWGIEVLEGGRFPFRYAFTRDDVFFLVVDASTGGVPADTAQMAWIRDALASPEARDAGLRLALGHLPLYPVAEGRDRVGEFQTDGDALRAVLEDGDVAMYISGHHHAYYPGRRGDLALLHAGALGQGARRLLGDAAGTSSAPPRTVTRLQLLPGLDSIVERTWRVDGDRLTPLDPASLPPRIDGPAGPIARRSGGG